MPWETLTPGIMDEIKGLGRFTAKINKESALN